MERQYLSLLERVLKDGEVVEGRNGTVRRLVGAHMRCSLEGGSMPFLTTKRLAWKTCLRELLWFISGSTDSKVLEARGVRIWAQNGSRAVLDELGFVDRPEGDLGPVYGHQWRHAGASYSGTDADYSGRGYDQLGAVIAALSDPEQRTSRRLLICSWQIPQIHEMALPPCHVLMQFHVTQGTRLACSVYQRSADVGLGLPFNLASYSMLTLLMARHCGLVPGELIYHLGDVHVYEEHVSALRSQLSRPPSLPPKMSIACRRGNINEYVEDDFELSDYQHAGELFMPMVP